MIYSEKFTILYEAKRKNKELRIVKIVLKIMRGDLLYQISTYYLKI